MWIWTPEKTSLAIHRHYDNKLFFSRGRALLFGDDDDELLFLE